jgi:hypothetical protein
MPSSDRTFDFRAIIREKELENPDGKRRKLAKSIQHQSERDGDAHIGKEYIGEAYVIVRCALPSLSPALNLNSSTT